MEKLKTLLIGGWGSASAFGSVGVSMETRIESWMRIAVLFAGLVSACLSIYWLHRINRVKLTKANEDLCEACRSKLVPKHCPIPISERPDDCPLTH